MKRKCIGIFIVMCILVFVMPTFVMSAENSYSYGRFAWDDGELICIEDKENNEFYYNLPTTLLINGKLCDSEDLEWELIEDSYVRYAVENETVISIDYDSEGEFYTDVEYKNGSFIINNGSTGNIPVYFGAYGNEILDENHTYDVVVYDYGVVVDDYRAKDGKVTLYNFIEYDLTLGLNYVAYVSTETEDFVDDGAIIEVTFDGKSKAELSSEFIDFADFEYTVAKNEVYKITVQLVDGLGNKLSFPYTYEVCIEELDYKNGIVTGVFETGYRGDEYDIYICDEEGNEYSYWIDEDTYVNRKRIENMFPYGATEDDLSSMLLNKPIQILGLSDEFIRSMRYDTSPENTQLLYNSEKKVFTELDGTELSLRPAYMYDGSRAYLSDEHIYDVTAYRNGIVINDYSAKNYSSTIKDIRITDVWNKGFVRTLAVAYTLSGETDVKVCGKLFKEDGTEYKTAEDIYGDEELRFENIANSNGNYTIEFWAEDNTGVRVSPIYFMKYTVECNEIGVGKITYAEKGINLNVWVDVDGEDEKEYTVTGKHLYLDDVRYDKREFCDEITSLTNRDILPAVKFVVDNNGNIIYIECDSTYTEYNKVTYSKEKECFIAGELEIVLTDKILYNDTYSEILVLDENHNYDIEVYGYIIAVTDFSASESDKYAIYGQSYSWFDVDKSVYIGCEATLTSDEEIIATMYGELYDGKTLVEKTSAPIDYTSAEIYFEELPNIDKTYTVKIWCEDNSGNRITPIYEYPVATKAYDIKSGKVVKQYLDDSSRYPYVCIADENGMEKTYHMYQTTVNSVKIPARESMAYLPIDAEIAFVADESNGIVEQISVYRPRVYIAQYEFTPFGVGDIEVDIMVTDRYGYDGAVVLAAAYDKNSALIVSDYIPLSGDRAFEGEEYSLFLEDAVGAKTVKMYLWKSMSTLVPFTPCIERRISQ